MLLHLLSEMLLQMLGQLFHRECLSDGSSISTCKICMHDILLLGSCCGGVKPPQQFKTVHYRVHGDHLQGPSFSVEGNLVKWQKWQFRVGFNYREGLVLHQVGYHDGGRLRPVLYRASLVEMAVPYGDPR